MSTSEQAIRRLMFRYAELQDAADFDAVAELFSHGIFQRGDGKSFRGPEVSAHRKTSNILHDGSLATKHVTTNITIDVDEENNSASAESYYTVFQGTDTLPLEPIVSGRYHDHFERIEGEWRFLYRRSHVDLVGRIETHRAH